MRHAVRGKKLGRTSSHRKAMLGNLATSLLRYHRVRTTHQKALAVRPVVDRLITRAKSGDLHARRQAARIIHDKDILRKLFKDIGPVYKERKGGYTRILKVGERKGDNAMVSILELVGIDPNNREAVVPYEEKRVKPKAKPVKKKKKGGEAVKMEEKKVQKAADEKEDEKPEKEAPKKQPAKKEEAKKEEVKKEEAKKAEQAKTQAPEKAQKEKAKKPETGKAKEPPAKSSDKSKK
jgi:large subunit ribosomal protein L17